MNDKINILPPEVYNILSAGEVVENPASVVKELVENAIDAGATKINVEIVKGGIDEITVTDNGSGCPEDQLLKVFLPHATSKIATANDIDNILSLGFRGEAMASISAVSQVEFTSKPARQEHAIKITKDGQTEIVGGNNGTTVRVANLFYNTPARRKFLKSENTEKNLVTNVIHNIIFSHPNHNIKYMVDGETNIDFRGTGLLSAIAQVYGIDDGMLEVTYRTADIKIGGYISNIKLSKKNKSRQIVIVNGRVIDGGIIAQTVNEIMPNYLMVGEYPVFVLTLDIPADKIDVNVHPQKREVRFDDKDTLINAIEMAIISATDKYFMQQRQTQMPKNTPTPTGTLNPNEQMRTWGGETKQNYNDKNVTGHNTIQSNEWQNVTDENATINTENQHGMGGDEPTQNFNGQNAAFNTENQYKMEKNVRPPVTKLVGKSFDPTATQHKSEEVFLRAMSFIAADSPNSQNETMVSSGSSVLHEFIMNNPLQQPHEFMKPQPEFEMPPEIEQTKIADNDDYKILGQVFETYLFVATGEQMLIIDQHAMAERINYDNFKRAMDTNNMASQTLLTPEIIKLSPKEQIAFEKIQPHLIAMGFECGEFGADSIRVLSIPTAMSVYGIDEFLRCILADRELQTNKLSDILKDRIAMAACKASIRAGDLLTNEQIASFMENYKK
ncbi:MAG: DNA mismatch repair endonuclease MutL, partial [Christensenellaceae bacterium]|nr:DNA mismatch repair endonuclease MutL [Christensenellaceae bacterium]